jgi:hypothetical protein
VFTDWWRINPNYIKYLRAILPFLCKIQAKDVRYFIDKDFDGLKGHPAGNDLYCTHTYSIENILVNLKVLKMLLQGEYRCNDENGSEDISNISELYCNRLTEFIQIIKNANQIIHYARTENLSCCSIDNDLKKYASINLEHVKPAESESELWRIVGMLSEVSLDVLASREQDFISLDPIQDWRGKYYFAFFRKFLADLKDDRGSKAPKYFKQRANMSFSPQADIIRPLASIVDIPQCLSIFIDSCCVLGAPVIP